jgi:1,4-dihydroxy-6-naphthoate synthase
MFYGLAKGRVDPGRWRFEHVLQDIQTLNERALRGELEITAISIHAYPYVADKYALTNCGASMGDGYGPMVVTREPVDVDWLVGKTIAVPGTMTTAFLALNLLMLGRGGQSAAKSPPARGRAGSPGFHHEVVMFDRILDHVAAGKADAGLIIHEGQLTYRNQKLHCVVDLGKWWRQETGYPLPLGGNVIRRDLGTATMHEIAEILERSIRYSLDHRAEAVEHALRYARDMGHELADEFVGMYVNKWTLDYGDVGRAAVRELLKRGHQAGLVPDAGDIDFI